MDVDSKFVLIRRKTRQRLIFSLITMGLYFSFVLNYVGDESGAFEGLGVGHVPGPVVMFVGLIIVFILLELIFLYINREPQHDSGQGK